jgi:hypothetical protein
VRAKVRRVGVSGEVTLPLGLGGLLRHYSLPAYDPPDNAQITITPRSGIRTGDPHIGMSS